MRAILWAWIIGFTALVLYMPPMLEKLPTRPGEAAQWRKKGAFEQSVQQSSTREKRVDISRLIITLLAINFLPAVALWRYNEIREWLQLPQSEGSSVGSELDTAFVRLGIVLISRSVASRYFASQSAIYTHNFHNGLQSSYFCSDYICKICRQMFKDCCQEISSSICRAFSCAVGEEKHALLPASDTPPV